MLTVGLAILKRFYGPVAVVLTVCLAWLLFRAGMTNLELSRGLKKAKAELALTHEKLATSETQFADLIRDYNSQARAADAREAELERGREEALQKQRSDYAKRTSELDRSLQLALDGLRHATGPDSRGSLKPAADSPAACRGYAADRAAIGVQDAEVALRIAADGDRAAVRLSACQQYINEVVLRGLPAQ